ncbi:GNAT domain-containing protein [Aspergillus crustosus]
MSTDNFQLQPQPVHVTIPETLSTLTTPRLILRPFRFDNQDDIAGMFRIRNRQDVFDTLKWPKIPDQTLADTKQWIRERFFTTPDASGAVGRTFYFTIFSKEDSPSSVLGAVGVNFLHPAPFVGYLMHPDVWGKGYATEALKAVIEAWWALPRTGVSNGEAEEEEEGKKEKEKLFGACFAGNAVSSGVLTKAGFEILGYNVDEKGERVVFMGLDRVG